MPVAGVDGFLLKSDYADSGAAWLQIPGKADAKTSYHMRQRKPREDSPGHIKRYDGLKMFLFMILIKHGPSDLPLSFLELSIPVMAVSDLKEAILQSDIACTCTPSKIPFCFANMWLRGFLLQRVGADNEIKQS